MTKPIVPKRWKRLIEGRLARLDERIAREMREEKNAREIGDATSDEQIEALEAKLDAIVNEQRALHQRLRWIEKRHPGGARPPKPAKN